MSDSEEVVEGFFSTLVRSGVVITYADWERLSVEHKAILRKAQEDFRAETAAMLATALRGPEGTAWVLRGTDDGDAFVGMHLEKAVDRQMEKAGIK